MDVTVCDPCRARSRSMKASFWCPYCSEAFCKSCCQFHQTMKLTKTHKVQMIADISQTERMQRQAAVHRFEALTPLTFNEKTQLREIDNVLIIMDGLCDTALTMKQMFFDLKMRNESEKNECMRKTMVFKDRLKQLAEEFERHIYNELEYLQQAENVQIESKIEECESIFNAIEISKELTQAMKSEHITSQTISKVNSTRQRCDEYKFTLQRIHSSLQPVQYNLAIDRNVSDALNTTPAIIGKIEVSHENDEDVTEHAGVKQTINLGRRESQVSDRSRPHISKRMDSMGSNKVNEFHLQRSDDHDELLITAICPLSTNDFITLDRNNNKLLLVRSDGAVITQYMFTSQIWDMTLVDSITAAVTVPDNDKIVLVKVRDNNLCAERLIKTTNICYGICAIEGFLIVTVKGGYVKIVTKAGEEVASIRHNQRGEILFNDPQHLATNRQQNEIYVSDYISHTVTALFLTGVKIDVQPKYIFRNNELRNPKGMCVDIQGSVYVCGFSSHNVIKLSPEGFLQHVVLTGIINPQSVALTTLEDQLMVSCLSSGSRSKHTQNVIQVFRL